ncbi:hypothetical protein FQN55_009616 [Onygenales sp. PD_40]|nr:hypothetical protein FQN55_009616 [Onygenales sp. PD_40]KAK2784948.1 hypothetical protein FQN53_008134 [Emmonsiellopsis sp. PD_33]KAK2792905.1 hypothetical protein FQN52_002583 [Onygenales sp. PD_12]KAK2805877.1 hypothetical protein FQN51_008651 [Onygenales sp. PD_10]
MNLLDLPVEILYLTADNLEPTKDVGQRDISSLSRTAKRLHDLLTPYLYRNNASEFHQSSALVWAAKHGKEATAKLSLQNGANPQASERRVSALQFASKNGHAVVVNLLLRWNAAVPGDQWPLLDAITNAREEVVKLLLENDCFDPNKRGPFGRTPLAVATSYGHWGVVKLLLDKIKAGTESEIKSGSIALYLAAEQGHEDTVKLLLDADVFDPNSNDFMPIVAACRSGREGVVRLFLEKMDTNPIPRAKIAGISLSAAVDGRDMGILRLLLGVEGVNPNVRDDQGCTALMIAVAKRYPKMELIQLFLDDRRVHPDIKNNEGQTPLSIAAMFGHRDIVELLLARDDVDRHSKSNTGWTPLEYAKDERHDEIAQLLKG